MADPITWLYIGAGVSAIGAVQQASAASSAADYNQQVAQQNAQIANQQRAVAQQQQQRQAQQRLGLMLTNAGGSGVEITGSVSDVLMDSARQAEFERQSIAYNYQLRANGYNSQSDLYGSQASNATTSGLIGAMGSVANGFAAGYSRTAGVGDGTGTSLSQYGGGADMSDL